MPIYDYFCESCKKEYSVIKSIKLYDGKDLCPDCLKLGNRVFSCDVNFLNAKVESAEYNPGLGCITKNKRDREEKAKRLGLIELGNENPEKLHKNYDKQREDKRKKEWDELI